MESIKYGVRTFTLEQAQKEVSKLQKQGRTYAASRLLEQINSFGK